MQCTTCKLEYVKYETTGIHELYNEVGDKFLVELELSAMACPECKSVNKSTIQVDID